LTIASRVIFPSPFYTTGLNAQDKYEAAITQAIGRAKRFGQEKIVHVYHFLTVETIDVDYYEARTRQVIRPMHGTENQGIGEEYAPGMSSPLASRVANKMIWDDVKERL